MEMRITVEYGFYLPLKEGASKRIRRAESEREEEKSGCCGFLGDKGFDD
jgi:hypothetical protein